MVGLAAPNSVDQKVGVESVFGQELPIC